MQEYTPLSNVLAGQVLFELKDKEMFKLVTLNHNETVETALRKLAGFKILSAPVEGPQKVQTMKMVDLMDIATAFVLCSDEKKCFSLPIEQVCNLSSVNECKVFEQMSNLFEIAKQLTDGNHRVLILDADNDKPVGIISQMDVARWLVKHVDNIPPSLRNLSAKQIMTPDPLCVKQTDTVISAVKKCVKHHYTGVGVEDDKGMLKANFSLSDCRGLIPENLHYLEMPVMKFLQETHIALKEPISVTEDTPFPTMVKLTQQHHIHRLYVVDKWLKPKGVISLSNFMQVLYKHAEASM